jgi:hypothetical protein
MDTTAAVTEASPIIYQLGAGWFFSPISKAKGEELGLKTFALYITGRSGVMGDITTESAISAIGFFNPGMVAKLFNDGTANHAASEVGRAYSECCVAWGRETFGQLDGADRAAGLARRLIDSVQPCGHALFSAWRSVPVPDDGPGALALSLQTLRELRGDCHMQACGAMGLTPLEAILAREGAERAKQFGWPEPYPDTSALVDARGRAEDLTDSQMARAYDTLSADERGEFVRLLQAAKASLPG